MTPFCSPVQRLMTCGTGCPRTFASGGSALDLSGRSELLSSLPLVGVAAITSPTVHLITLLAQQISSQISGDEGVHYDSLVDLLVVVTATLCF